MGQPLHMPGNRALQHAQPGARAGAWRGSRGLWAFVSLSACSVDTVLYEQRSATSEADRPLGKAGAGADRPLIYGCDAADEGSVEAIFARVVISARGVSDWVSPGRSCQSDSDCRTALLTPSCDRASALCATCPEPAARRDYIARLATCLVDAIPLCCSAPEADQDCVFRGCVSACGPL